MADIYEYVEEQPIEKLKNKYFSIRSDQATGCSDVGHLIAYMHSRTKEATKN
jgi:hypothetical protein